MSLHAQFLRESLGSTEPRCQQPRGWSRGAEGRLGGSSWPHWPRLGAGGSGSSDWVGRQRDTGPRVWGTLPSQMGPAARASRWPLTWQLRCLVPTECLPCCVEKDSEAVSGLSGESSIMQ